MIETVGDNVTLSTMAEMATASGQNIGGGSGLEVLLGQPLNLLAQFLPPEDKVELDALLDVLNGK